MRLVQLFSLLFLLLFLQEKQEWWWIYVTDRRKIDLITPPQQIFNLKEEEKVECDLLRNLYCRHTKEVD